MWSDSNSPDAVCQIQICVYLRSSAVNKSFGVVEARAVQAMSFPMVALGKVIKPVERAEVPGAGTTYRQVGVKLWGVGAYERESMDGSQTRYKTLSRVEADDIIVNKIWARNGSVAVVPKNLAGCFVSSEFPTFVPIREKLDPQWFHWLTKTKFFWEKCDEKSQGTSGKNRIRPERFLEIEIPLPSISEQRRIVARIEELVAKIEEARGLRRKAGEEIEALFESAVGTTFNQLKSGERKKLSSLTSKIGSGSTPKGGRDIYPSSGIPFIRSLNVRMRNFQWDNIAFIDKSTHGVMKGTIVKPTDVLLNITGASIGRVTCAPSDLAEANVNQHVAIIRPIEKLNPRYLMYWLSQPEIQEFINDKQKGATRQGFTKAQIETFEVPLPPSPNSAASSPTSTNFRQRWTHSGASRQRPAPNWMR
jgi:type I restriction enzyme S subunit